MPASRHDHPTSSLRGADSSPPQMQSPSHSPPPETRRLYPRVPDEATKDGLEKSPGGGGGKRRAEGQVERAIMKDLERENKANSPSISHLSSQDSRQQQTGGSRSPSSSHPSVLNGGNNNVEDPAKRRRLVSGSNGPPSSANKDQQHSSDPSVDFDKPPISPVVLGFNLSNTDPGVRDTVRSALRMKEQQQMIIQQRRGGEGHSSAASTPPQASTPKVPVGGGDVVVAEGGGAASIENEMDVDVKPEVAPAVEVQAASPALASGGFSSGGLATRTHEEGRAKAGGLSIFTPASVDAAQSVPSPRTGGPSPKPLSARPVFPQNPSQPDTFFPPPQQERYAPQAAGQPPRSASSSSQHQSSNGAPSSRPSIPPRVPSNGYPSNGGGNTPNGMSHHPMPSPAAYGGSQQQQQQQPPYNPPGSARGPPSASYYAQHRQHSPSPPPSNQKNTFLAPFERFYDALVDSRTLQQTVSDLSARSTDIHRRGEDEIRRFQHTHQQAANLLNTLQVSSTSLQEMVRKEVAVVREETRREVEAIWKRVRQLEGGFTAAGLAIPPPLPSTSTSSNPPPPPAPRSSTGGGKPCRRIDPDVARVGGETSTARAASASGSGSNRDEEEEEEEDQILDEEDSQEEGSSKGRKGTRGGKAGRGASRPPKGVRGARIGS
ncbi:hypothetical protein BDY24DRAFT_437453 [Mrakia frigida]|uniref:uncharacterized protein n=1 Tax=Mrakia frigida TaxID=29902 RepID=UPI003FCBF5A0